MKRINFLEHWVMKPMTEVVKWASGGTPKATVKEYYDNGSIPWLVIGDLNDGIVTTSATKITQLGLENSSAKVVPANTLLVAMYGSIGKLGITGMECCTNQAIAFAKELIGVTTKYMYYFMMSRRNELIEKGKGGTQKNISQTVLNSMNVPVPPLPEQQRIVAKIEELFAELDNSVAMLKKVKEQLEIYRQAVLDSAFENIRENEVITTFFEISNGLTKNSQRNAFSIQMPYLRVANVYFNKIDLTEVKEIGVKENEVDKVLLKKDDLLFVEGNGSKEQIGRVAVWNGKIKNCLHQNHIIKARTFGNMIPQYAMYYFMSQMGREQILDVASSTSGLYTLSSNKIRNLSLPNCSLSEQQRIVNEIENKLSLCSNLSESIEMGLQQADALRQSILKKAFEGEL